MPSPIEMSRLDVAKADTLAGVACEVTRDVLETMFFAIAEPVSCRHPEGTDCWISAMVQFDGSPHGELGVMLPRELALAFACGFLGLDPEEVSVEEENQIACELANMICGAVLSRLHPDSRVALAAPELVPAGFASMHGIHQCFETPEGMLAVTMAARS